MPKVFISYVTENADLIARLESDLRAADVEVWTNRLIKPGQRWKDEIRRAIESGDYFLACFSKELSKRSRSYMNKELALAIEELELRPVNTTWFIPAKINACEIPDRSINEGTLRDLQWVDLHEDWGNGVKQILSVVRPEPNPILVDAGFLAAFGHQTIAPLASIIGSLDGFRDGSIPRDQFLDRLDYFRASAAQVVRRIIGLQAMASVLQDNKTIFKARVKVDQLLERVIRDLEPLARHRGVRFKIENGQLLDQALDCDQRLVEQLFFILLDNAAKYSISDSVVAVSARKLHTKGLTLEFLNKGLPLPENPRLVFGRGYRSERSRMVDPAGTGLGLYLAAQIVKAHDGTIECRSREGGLTVFSVSFPA